jgi:acetyl esterase/lipase
MKIAAAALLLLAALTAGAEDYAVHRDLPYAEPANPRQSLDVYSPLQGRNHPVILWIHGGGWTYGDKSDLQQGSSDPVIRKPHAFAARGFVFVAINYRLFPQVGIGEMEADVAKSVRWVHDHIRQYGGDPDSIVAMGHSAGAQLVALFCTDPSYLIQEGLSLHVLKGCVPVDGDMYYPPLQLDTDINRRRVNSSRLKFPNDGAEREYSSVFHVSSGKGIPPFLILCVADHPETGTLIQSQVLASVLRISGVPEEMVACPGKVHETLNADLGLPGDKATEAVLAFLAKYAR